MPADDAGLPDAGPPAPHLRDDVPVSYAEVYSAELRDLGRAGMREWLPVDVTAHPDGQLWIVQQLERDPAFDDDTECTERGLVGGPHDCFSLEGSTVALQDPTSSDPATAANGRATLVVDWNSLHFMRRPSAIAFGATELSLGVDGPGASEAGVTGAVTFPNTFATCHEHWTGNPTDTYAFIGPTLWTDDPNIYNGSGGDFSWSNGAHLDMLHATAYCMGIAYERDNVYWTFNGLEGTLDRYDFGSPHFPGHSNHEDGVISRYDLGEAGRLARLPTVPSNLVMRGTDLYVADTGNGRVLRVDTASPTVEFGTFLTFDSLDATLIDGVAFEVLLDAGALGTEWGGASEPSGLAILDDDTLLVANHATGHISLFDLDGTLVRTLDTGMGAGLGGLTVMDGVVYFIQMSERRVYRIDVGS